MPLAGKNTVLKFSWFGKIKQNNIGDENKLNEMYFYGRYFSMDNIK